MMCAVTVKPDSAMRTHNDHRIENKDESMEKREIIDNKNIEKRQHGDHHRPADGRHPVLFVFKDIYPVKSLVK